MTKRLVTGPVWFLAILATYELAWALLGAPRLVGPLVAVAVAALVVLDPGNVLWASAEGPRGRRRTPDAGRPASSAAVRGTPDVRL